MTTVPTDNITLDALSEWYDMSQKLKHLRAAEMLLRKKLFGIAFPDPEEGTNKYELEDGYVLNGQYQLNRDVGQGAFDAIKEKLREEHVTPEELVGYKPSLKKAHYNKLTDTQRLLFDQCLIIKPASPSMEIVLPAKAKKAKEAKIKGNTII